MTGLQLGQGNVGSLGAGVSLGGTVFSFRAGQVQDKPLELPASAVPMARDLQTSEGPQAKPPGARPPAAGMFEVPGGLPSGPGVAPGVIPGAAEGRAFEPSRVGNARPDRDPENPAMGDGSRGRAAGRSREREDEGSWGFSRKAAELSRHLAGAGRMEREGSEFAEGFGRRLTDIMLDSMEYRPEGWQGGPAGSRAASLGQAHDAGLARASAGDAPWSAVVPEPEAAAPAGLPAPAAGFEDVGPGFAGIGLLALQSSALSVRFTLTFPGRSLGLRSGAAEGRGGDGAWRKAAGSSRARDVLLSPEGGAAGRPGVSAEPDLPYPGGYGGFLASVGAGLAPTPGGDGFAEPGSASPAGWAALDQDLRDALSSSRSRRGPVADDASPSSPSPVVPLSIYALLPLVLAALELRSRL